MYLPRSVAAFAFVFALTVAAQKPLPRTPVLVELFTSEGCSSCPPADALLGRLEREQPVAGAEVIVLEEHVDYWDSLGWRDRFSSPLMTERQRRYGARFRLDDIYTPQMVVAGSAQLVGSDAQAAAKAVRSAADAKTYVLELSDVRLENNRVVGHVEVPAGSPGDVLPNQVYGIPPTAEFYAALVSPHQSTAVRAGENGGRTLEHAGVVRSLTRLGDSADLRRARLDLSLDTRGISGPLRVVVFAEVPDQGPILGVAAFDLAPEKQTRSTRLAASLK